MQGGKVISPCCGLSIIHEPIPAAERLANSAKHILSRPDQLMIAGPDVDEMALAFASLAVRFWNRGAGFVFRALVEEWSLEQIVKELH